MDMPPKEVIEAAERVGQWFAERNVTDWCLGPCASRAELENVKQVEFPRRVEKVVEGWRKKCDRLEDENARLREAVALAMPVMDAHSGPTRLAKFQDLVTPNASNEPPAIAGRLD